MNKFKTIEVPVEDACEIRYGDGDPDIWEMVVDGHNVDDSGRWYNIYEAIVRHKPTDKLYSINWQVGATESQWLDCRESFGIWSGKEVVEFTEVIPVEKTIIDYKAVKVETESNA